MNCPLSHRPGLHDRVHLFASPVRNLLALPPGYSASDVVLRADDFRGPADGIAINAADNQSGWGALAAAGLTGPATFTGCHAASMEAVASGRAHPAAIDVVTWAIAPYPGLRVHATTPPMPAPPFVTADPALVASLLSALTAAVAAMSPADRSVTRLSGLIRLPEQAWDPPLPEAPRLRLAAAA